MISTIIWLSLLCLVQPSTITRCLTGYMSDVQSWVTEDGKLTPTKGSVVIDLSSNADAITELQAIMATHTRGSPGINRLSMAKCGFTGVPPIFSWQTPNKRPLAATLEYLTLYKNNFYEIVQSAAYDVSLNATNLVETTGLERNEKSWAAALRTTFFSKLRELDLRSCSIRTIAQYTFKNMPSLEALYLGENNIVEIEAYAFFGLYNLHHLDISNNVIRSNIADAISIDPNVFEPLLSLKSLDVSNTVLTQANAGIFRYVCSNLIAISICNSGLNSLHANAFLNTNIKYLDLSGNTQMLSTDNIKFIFNLAPTLEVLYADRTGLTDIEVLKNFRNLEVVKLSNNALTYIPVHVVGNWNKVKILDLSGNRVPSWYGPIWQHMPNLTYLSLMRNNLNMISDAMMEDLSQIPYISMSDNYYVCSCQSRTFIDLAINMELRTSCGLDVIDETEILPINHDNMKSTIEKHRSAIYHTGFADFYDLINSRVPATHACCKSVGCPDGDFCSYLDLDYGQNASYLLVDFGAKSYSCYVVNTDIKKPFENVPKCLNLHRSAPYEKVIEAQVAKFVIFSAVAVIVFVAIVIVLCRNWWCFKYFCITVKNSAMLSLIGSEDKNLSTDPIYNYDVFVSYCNDDRSWVLDDLLLQLETDCNVSVCLHERDFQVGLSILENIVSCMDRSRSIMLVLSNKFLLSQWCQFEMHLAQHRLLETRREDLILILLEDIPRKKRPNTLHYLMMTKTYIVWPEDRSGHDNFWRRVRRTLNNANKEKVSIA